MDVNPNHTYQPRHCGTNNIRRGRIHASQLKQYHEHKNEGNYPDNILLPQVTNIVMIIDHTSDSGQQMENSQVQDLVIEKIHKATRTN